MQRSNDTVKASLPQALVETALAFLSSPPPPGQPVAPPKTLSTNNTLVTDSSSGNSAPQILPTDQNDATKVASTEALHTKVQALLVSLLQYVDNTLMQTKSRHDRPPYAAQDCVSCNFQWDNTSILSTFLPLSPCNHWIHYRCLIWLVTRDNSQKDKCPACKKQLFQWDGISALTLATRTSLPMGKMQFTTAIPGTQAWVSPNRLEYEQECQVIEHLIDRRFNTVLTQLSGYADGSPDLVQCFNEVLNGLRLDGRPQAKWLQWSTTT